MSDATNDDAVRFEPLGDAAAIASLAVSGDATAAWLAACDAAPLAGVGEVVAGFDSLAAYFDPDATELAAVAAWMRERLDEASGAPAEAGRRLTIPVCYDGEDLTRVAERAGLSAAEVVRRHAGVEYRVRVIGFSPGFPYLEGLPPELHTPRRATPRTAAPAGSVAIGGPYTGVYPHTSPGGWNVVGRTGARLFDAARSEPSLLRPGDRVRFTAVDAIDESRGAADHRPTPSVDERDVIARVVSPGVQTTLQDLGRTGWRRIGVSPSGAMDPRSLLLANRLVGVADSAVAIEAALVGPVLEFAAAATVATVGASVAGLPSGRPFRVEAGERLDLTRLSAGARCYLAVAGGWRSDTVLGSGSTDLRAGFGGHGGRALRVGDCLAVDEESRLPPAAAADWSLADGVAPRVRPGEPTELRVLRGPQAEAFTMESWEALLDSAYRVSPQSSRMGVRLIGHKLRSDDMSRLASQPVAHGALQVPPDGQPIALGADRQTLGGYPIVACVVSVDLPLLGQLAPGDEVRFREIDLSSAARLRAEDQRRLRIATEGIRLHG